MTAFAGIVTFDGAPYDGRTEEQLARAIASPRKGSVHARRASGAVLVQRAAVSPSGQGPPPPADGEGRVLFAADALLDNRAELGAALAMAPPELTRTSDATLIHLMHRRFGAAGIARCLGAFAFALWDPDDRRLVLGRDCLGNRALFFHRGRGFVAFATTLGALLALPGVPRELDEIALAHFLAVNLTEPRRTFYLGIERVATRTLVAIDRDSISRNYYWAPDLDAPPPYRRDEDYIARARELLDQAVAAATVDTPDVAISLSGGLDSSAIAATAARLGRAATITCYTMVPPAGTQVDVGASHYPDERDKVQALARMYPALDVRFIAPESLHPFEQDITRFFARANMPVSGPSVLGPHAFLYDAVVAAGHRALLVGNNGNFGLTWSGRFSLLALLRSGQIAAFARELNVLAKQSDRGLARTFGREAIMPMAPLPVWRLFHRLKGRDPDSVAHYSALDPAFIAEHDLPRQWQADGFDPWPSVNGWNPARYRAELLFDKNQVGRDFKGMSEDLRGFELRDPLGDRRLLEFVLAVPEPMFRRNGVPRSFARAVLADRLPREILEERRRGALAVTWFRRLDSRRQDLAAELERLGGSPLARRLLDLPRLKRMMEQWPADENAAELRHADYRAALSRGIHVGRFIQWVEGGNS